MHIRLFFAFCSSARASSCVGGGWRRCCLVCLPFFVPVSSLAVSALPPRLLFTVLRLSFVVALVSSSLVHCYMCSFVCYDLSLLCHCVQSGRWWLLQLGRCVRCLASPTAVRRCLASPTVVCAHCARDRDVSARRSTIRRARERRVGAPSYDKARARATWRRVVVRYGACAGVVVR